VLQSNLSNFNLSVRFISGILNPCYMNAFGCEDRCNVTDKGNAQCTCMTGALLPDGKSCGRK
jgi:hypothetical protein